MASECIGERASEIGIPMVVAFELEPPPNIGDPDSVARAAGCQSDFEAASQGADVSPDLVLGDPDGHRVRR